MLLTCNHFSNPEVAAHLLYTKKTSIFHSTSMHYIPIINPYMKCIENHFAPKLDPFNQDPSFLAILPLDFFGQLRWPTSAEGTNRSSNLRLGRPVPCRLGRAPKTMAGDAGSAPRELPQEIAGATVPSEGSRRKLL